MEVKFIIGAVTCNDPDYKPSGGGNKVGKCEKCQTMVWLTPKASTLKQEKPNHSVWCKGCIEKIQDEDDVQVHILDIDESEGIDDVDSFFNKLNEIEEKYFARAKHGHSQTMAMTREILPSLVSCAMGRLKIWNNLEDLTLALVIRTLVEEILLRQRETLGELVGPEATFHGYDRNEIMQILQFIFGTSKALEDARNKLREEGDDALYSDEVVDRWTEGWSHWADGFHGEGWGDTGDDWNL